MLVGYLSEAASRRSRCGAVRGWPVLSSHFSPGLAPQVGHRTARIGSFGAFMTASCTPARESTDQL
jgi:hypothetical protein